jgi:hypothetical protein
MPRPKSLKPKYCLHKSSGRAFVVLDGQFVYLGQHGTQESRDAYDRVIGEWIARGRTSPALTQPQPRRRRRAHRKPDPCRVLGARGEGLP